VKVWNVETGKEAYTVWGPNNAVGPIQGVAFSPDGRYLASGSNQIIFADARTGKEIRRLGSGGTALSFSPDGHFLAAVHGQTLTLWEADTGTKRFEVTPNLGAATNRIGGVFRAVAYSPDGRRLVTSGTTAPGDVRVWDAATGRELFSLRGLKEWADGVAWSPDGRRIAVASWDKTVKVFDADNGLERFALRGHESQVQGVAFSPDGSILASGGGDQTVRLWDATRGQEVLTLQEGNHRIDGLALSPDGKLVGYAVGRFNFGDIEALRVCATDTGRDVLTVTNLSNVRFDSRVEMAFSPNGARFAVVQETGNKIRFWDLATGREGPALEFSGQLNRVLFTPDGSAVALVLHGKVIVRDLGSGNETFSMETHGSFGGWAFSPDGALAAFKGDPYQGISLLEIASGKIVRAMQGPDGQPYNPAMVSSLAFSADSVKLLMCEMAGDVAVWDTASGKLLHRHEGLAGKDVQFAAFSPDGKRLATVSRERKEIVLWDTTVGQQVFAFDGASRIDPEQVRALAWSADGSTLGAADSAGNVRLWSIAPRTEETQAARRAAWGDYALNWHRRAAGDNEREKNWFAAAFHLSQMIDAGPPNGALFLRRGLANAQAERWEQAPDDLGRAIQLDRIDTFETRYRHTLLLRWKGDLPSYRRAVAFLIEHWGTTTDAKIAKRVLQTCLLDAEKTPDRKAFERLANVVLSKQRSAVTVPENFGTRLEEAKTYAELLRILRTIGREREKRAHLTWPFAVLLCERLGDKYEASFWLDQVAKQIQDGRSTFIGMFEGWFAQFPGEEVGWQDVLEHDLFQREIDALRKKGMNRR
jgi:WD40 repeat protein